MKKKLSDLANSAALADGATIETEEEPIDDERDVLMPLGYHRGIRGCLKDGWRVYALNASRYLVQLLPAALIVGIGSAQLFHFLVQYYADHIAPALFFIEAGVDASLVWQQAIPQTHDVVAVAALLLLYIVCLAVGRGSLWTQIAQFNTTQAFPRKKWLMRDKTWLQTTVRCLAYNAVCVIAFLLVAAIVGAIAYATSWWYALLFLLPVALLLTVVAIPGRTAFVLGTPWRTTLQRVRHEGFRRFGGYLILVCLTFLPLLLAFIVLVIPSANFVLAHNANAVNAIINEPSGISSLAELFDYVVLTLAFALFYLVSTFQTWTLTLKASQRA